MNTDEVKTLIEKFLSGKTSLKEEQVLDDFFKHVKNIPEELSPYKQMFSYFDGGMTDGGLLANDDNGQHPEQVRSDAKHQRTSIWRIAAAAVAGLVILAGAYNVAVTNNTNDRGRAQEKTLAQTAKKADTLTVRTDSMSQKERKEDVPERKRKLNKWRFKPAPPEILLAEKEAMSVSDSIDENSIQMAEDEIRKVEQEQQYIIRLLKAIDIINSAEIASVADEVDVY